MFNFDNLNYDVQATRREAREEGREEVKKQMEEERRRLKAAIGLLLNKGATIPEVAGIVDLPEQEITALLA
jgi:predicted transposase YdaD